MGYFVAVSAVPFVVIAIALAIAWFAVRRAP